MNSKKEVTTIWLNSDDEPLKSSVVLDSTWAQTFHGTFCEVDITVVAGNRESALDSTLDPNSKKPSQVWQKRKYRYIIFEYSNYIPNKVENNFKLYNFYYSFLAKSIR